MCSKLNNLLQLLSSTDELAMEDAWDALFMLVIKGFFGQEDAKSVLALLSNPDETVRFQAWSFLPTLIDQKLVSPEEVKGYLPFLLQLLSNPNPWVRWKAWKFLSGTIEYLISAGFLSLEDARPIFQFLLSPIESLRSQAWDRLCRLFRNPDEVRDYLPSYFQLLSSPEEYIRRDASPLLSVLAERGPNVADRSCDHA